MDPYIGEIKLMPLTYEPDGWMYCDGRQLLIQKYTALYALIGTYYGGDGKTNFNLPDLRGRVPAHLGALLVGAKNGTETVTLTVAQTPPHSHTVAASQVAANQTAGLNHYIAAPVSRDTPPQNLNLYTSQSGGAVTLASSTVSTAGGGASHNNMQPYLTLNYFIAVQGVFPPRP